MPEILRHIIVSDLRRLRGHIRPVYHESRKRELKTRPIYECRCDERLKTKSEKSTLLVYTGLLEKRAIEDLSVVSSVRFHAGDKTHKEGVYANLRCSAASSHGGCDAKKAGPVRRSSKYPTLLDCLVNLDD
jgi:hypothetical protein